MRVLVGCDLHKRTKDITTIRGYVEANQRVQRDIYNFIKENNVDIFISAGDWYDGGYGADIGAALVHTASDIELHKLLKSQFYGVIGNHIRVRMDSNPELFLIQPHDTFVSRWKCDRDYQIIRTPRYIYVDGVQFSLCHYNFMATCAADYKPIRLPEAKYHVGIFHTEKVIPYTLLRGLNQYMVSNNNDIMEALSNVDYAVVGHIHKPLGKTIVEHENGWKTVVNVPGSLANTEYSEVSYHEYVLLPMFEISNGDVSVTDVEFSLHTECCEFSKKGSVSSDEIKLKSLRSNSKEFLYADMVGQTVLEEDQMYMSLNLFLEKNNYTKADKELLKLVIRDPNTTEPILQSYRNARMEGDIDV